METKEIYTNEQMQDLPKAGLARKYKCSPKYVSNILKGERDGRRSYIAAGIRQDAALILEILKK